MKFEITYRTKITPKNLKVLRDAEAEVLHINGRQLVANLTIGGIAQVYNKDPQIDRIEEIPEVAPEECVETEEETVSLDIPINNQPSESKKATKSKKVED